MGIASFLLFLISISGIVLVINKTQGIRNFFKRIEKQKKAPYYHTILGRLSFIPILIVALSGAYLCVTTLVGDVTEEETVFPVQNKTEFDRTEFPIFQETMLSEVQSLYFPFSAEEEDYLILQLTDRKVKIHQFTGQLVSQENVSSFNQWKALSMTLHTGRGQLIWAVVLGLVCFNLLYFMYSGTKITWDRLRSKTRNKISKDKADIILLVGSENGATQRFALLLYKALLKAGQLVYVSDMNEYSSYKKASKLIILTSTYGNGEAPFNARYFLKKVNKIEQNQTLQTYIVGFGSMSYPKFCQYAKDVQSALEKNPKFELKAPYYIHGQSYTSFKLGIDEWKNEHQITCQLPDEDTKKKTRTVPFIICNKMLVDDGYSKTFTLELKAPKKCTLQSGDLLAIAPPEDNLLRYYSIGGNKNGNIVLSIKKHELGKCSNYLIKQEVGDRFEGSIKQNPDFHLPKKREVLMIANGTGIAPFLGMMRKHSKQDKTLFYGGRNSKTFELYKSINAAVHNNTLNAVHFALSKENQHEKYVQDLVRLHQIKVMLLLKNKGTIMICGSITMRDGVLEVLQEILQKNKHGQLEKYIQNKQILMDCY